MAFTEFVPGMKPGSMIRNVIVGFLYVLFFYLIPFVLAYAVFRNRNGIADKLSDIPGISSGGGIVSAGVIFLISFVVLSIIAAALPADEAPRPDETSTGSDGATDGGSDEEQSDEPSEETTESDASAEEQQQEIDEAEESDVEGEEANTAESELEDRDLSNDDLIPVFEALVESEGMTVDTAEMQGDTFVVEYRSSATTEQEILNEMGYVAGAYAGMVKEGHTSDRMEVAIFNQDGVKAGTFYVEYDWAEAFANDEITADEFALRVYSTLEAENQSRIEGGDNVAIA